MRHIDCPVCGHIIVLDDGGNGDCEDCGAVVIDGSVTDENIESF